MTPGGHRYAVPCVYNDRMIISENYVYGQNSTIKLFDISELENPVLLDTKENVLFYKYLKIENYILEYYLLEPTKVYNLIDTSFTDEIQIVDFDTGIFNLQVDEQRDRIISADSYYNFRTFIYELTGSGLEIIPEMPNNISINPNPLSVDASTRMKGSNIMLQIEDPKEKYSVDIFNVKGQHVRSIDVDNSSLKNDVRVFWDGKDKTNRKVGSGVYFISLSDGRDVIASKKCMVLK